MRRDLLQLAAALAEQGESYVIATVVRREAPSSAQSGDTALITSDGTFHGWLGGSCTRATVVAEARKAIQTGWPSLISITPDPDATVRTGVVTLAMTCHSGGTVDVYIDPVLPAPRLVIFGVSPAAQALARFAKVLGYQVEAVDPEATATLFPTAEFITANSSSPELLARVERDRPRIFTVVATLGIWDEEALRSALTLNPRYVGLVASKTRFGKMHAILRDQGITQEQLDRIRCPAGLGFGGVTPEEIALAITCEIVQTLRAESVEPTEITTPAMADRTEPVHTVDPVCGMTVDPTTTRFFAEVGNRTYYFCCGGCRERFVADPTQFVSSLADATHTR